MPASFMQRMMVSKGVVGSFQLELPVRLDGVVHRHMERVGVVIPVGDTGDLAVDLLVDADEPAGKSFGGGGEEGEVEAGLFRFVIHALAHMGDDLKTQLLALFAFAVMEAGKGF